MARVKEINKFVPLPPTDTYAKSASFYPPHHLSMVNNHYFSTAPLTRNCLMLENTIKIKIFSAPN